jgi:hypothetical protein
MPGSPQLIPRPNPRALRRQSSIKQQVDVHSLALEVQTLSLMLSDLRGRLSELEKKSNTDKITDADRGLLKNLDTMFGKPNAYHAQNVPGRREARLNSRARSL